MGIDSSSVDDGRRFCSDKERLGGVGAGAENVGGGRSSLAPCTACDGAADRLSILFDWLRGRAIGFGEVCSTGDFGTEMLALRRGAGSGAIIAIIASDRPLPAWLAGDAAGFTAGVSASVGVARGTSCPLLLLRGEPWGTFSGASSLIFSLIAAEESSVAELAVLAGIRDGGVAGGVAGGCVAATCSEASFGSPAINSARGADEALRQQTALEQGSHAGAATSCTQHLCIRPSGDHPSQYGATI